MKKKRILAAALAVCCALASGCAGNAQAVPDTTTTATATAAPETTPAPVTTTAAETDEKPPTTPPAPDDPTIIRAAEILAQMTLEEKVGQMFIARCPATGGAQDVEAYRLGGYILFGGDFKNQTPETVAANIKSYQDNAEIGMFIGVDEEGGTVVRVSKYPAFRESPFKAPMDVYAEGGLELLRADAAEKSELLLSLGINMNFAPVCDVPDSAYDFIYDRSFGTDCDITYACVSAVVAQMKESGVISVLKHFPGYGNNVDTHTGVAVDERDYGEFSECDLLPFFSGIEAGAACVLVSHNIVNCMDPDAPASLSPAVHTLLRSELGFDGVIITDDLSMDAIKEFAGSNEAAVLAVIAGNDLLCVDDYTVQIPAVIEAVKSGEISEGRIDESVMRILRLKLQYGIIG